MYIKTKETKLYTKKIVSSELQVWIQRKGAAMSYKAKIFNRNVLKTCPTSKKADPCIRFLTT